MVQRAEKKIYLKRTNWSTDSNPLESVMGGWDSHATEREPSYAFQTWNGKSEGAALKLAPVQLEGKKFV